MADRSLFDLPVCDLPSLPVNRSDLFDLLDPREGEEILYLGCSDARGVRRLLECGADVVGIDEDEYAVAAARKRGLRALLGQAETLEYIDRFDAIYLDRPEYRIRQPRRALERMARALKKGGRMVLDLGIAGDLADLEELMERMIGEHSYASGKIERYLPEDRKRYLDAAESTGLKVVEARRYYRITEPDEEWLARLLLPRMTLLGELERSRFISELWKRMKSEFAGKPILDRVILRLRLERSTD